MSANLHKFDLTNTLRIKITDSYYSVNSKESLFIRKEITVFIESAQKLKHMYKYT